MKSGRRSPSSASGRIHKEVYLLMPAFFAYFLFWKKKVGGGGKRK
jgi:hypothetical protein